MDAMERVVPLARTNDGEDVKIWSGYHCSFPIPAELSEQLRRHIEQEAKNRNPEKFWETTFDMGHTLRLFDGDGEEHEDLIMEILLDLFGIVNPGPHDWIEVLGYMSFDSDSEYYTLCCNPIVAAVIEAKTMHYV